MCDSQRPEPFEFEGPSGWVEAEIAVDVDRDGVDDLIMIGGTAAYSLVASVWRLLDGRIRPVTDVNGEQLRVEGSGWWPEKTTEAGWIGCDDLDGDGRPGFATGTYDVIDGTVAWEGRELVIDNAVVVAAAPIAGTDVYDPETLWPSTRPCLSAQVVRELDLLPSHDLTE